MDELWIDKNDIDPILESEHDELKAHCERLQKARKVLDDGGEWVFNDFVRDGYVETSFEEALEETPKQSLAEIQA